MKAEGFNWYGESSDEDEEDEQLAAKEEKAPLDLASLLKGETADKKDNSPKSIGEIFGISKSEDGENTEPSTFDKIIDRTLEQDLKAPEATGPKADDGVSEYVESSEPPTQELSLESSGAENIGAEDDELAPADAVGSKTVYEGGHEYPLADMSAANSEPPQNSGDSEEARPSQQEAEAGRTQKVPDSKVSETKPGTEPAGEAAPNSESAGAEFGDAQPSAEASQPSNIENEPAVGQAEQASTQAKPEEDTAQDTEPPESSPAPETESSDPEAPEEAEERARRTMEQDEGSEDEQPPIYRNSEAAGAEPGPFIRSSNERLPDTEKNQSPAGTLALLLGVREIFKRRKGDKENKQALEDHERLEEQRRQEIEAAQERTRHELDLLRQTQRKPETILVNDEDIAANHLENTANNNEFQKNIYVDQTEAENFIEPSKASKFDRRAGLSGDFFSQEPESDIEGLDESSQERSDAGSPQEQAEQYRKWNQEIDGELALDNRHEVSSVNKIPTASIQNLGQSGEGPIHISEIIAGSEHIHSADPDSYASKGLNLNQLETVSKNDELRSSIMAGVTIGSIIAVLAAIFLLFR